MARNRASYQVSRRTVSVLVDAEFVEQDSVSPFCIPDQLVVRDDLDVAIALRQGIEVALVIRGLVVPHLDLVAQARG